MILIWTSPINSKAFGVISKIISSLQKRNFPEITYFAEIGRLVLDCARLWLVDKGRIWLVILELGLEDGWKRNMSKWGLKEENVFNIMVIQLNFPWHRFWWLFYEQKNMVQRPADTSHDMFNIDQYNYQHMMCKYLWWGFSVLIWSCDIIIKFSKNKYSYGLLRNKRQILWSMKAFYLQ